MVLSGEAHGIISRFVKPIAETEDAMFHFLQRLWLDHPTVPIRPDQMRKIGKVKITAITPIVNESNLTLENRLDFLYTSVDMYQCNGTVCILLAILRQKLPRLLFAKPDRLSRFRL